MTLKLHISTVAEKLMSKNSGQSLIYITIAAVLWSTGGVLVKSTDLSPLALAGARSLLAAIVILPLFKFDKGGFWDHLLPAFWYVIMVITFITATKLTSAANAIALEYTAPLFVGIFGQIVYKIKLKKIDWLISGVIILGICLILIGEYTMKQMVGNCIGIICATAFAMFTL